MAKAQKFRSLTETQAASIFEAVDSVFDLLLARFLERPPQDKRIYIGWRPRVTLPGLFGAAARDEGSSPDDNILRGLIRIAEGYIEAQREATKAKVVKAVEAWINHPEGKATVETALGGELTEVWGRTKSQLKMIAESESTTARNTGSMDGIVRINALHAIEDPVVYFIVVRDNVLCPECKRLHLLDDGTTPRLWYLSEIGRGYHKRGEPNPKLPGLHPHCRCTMATLLPGWAVSATGLPEFRGFDYDAMAEQRGISKGETIFGDILTKAEIQEYGLGPKPPKSQDLGRDLVVVHNLTPDNLAHAHQLGALPAPSIAIAHKDHPLEGFGDVTLIGDRNLIDPNRTPVFNADIYSPRHPKARYRVKDKAVSKFKDWIKPHAEATDSYFGSVEDELNRHGPDRLLNDYRMQRGLGHAFLSEKGVKLRVPTQPAPLMFKWAGMPAVQDFVARHGADSSADYGGEYHKGFSEAVRQAIAQHADHVIQHEGFDKEDRQGLIDSHTQNAFGDEPGAPVMYSRFHRMVEDAKAAGTQVPDHSALGKKIERELKKHPEFEDWVRDKTRGLVGDMYLPKWVDKWDTGPVERKIPYTLTNILKQMTKSVRAGEEGFKGLGFARSKGATQFKTLEQIRGAKARIVSPETFKQQKEQIDNRFGELADAAHKYYVGSSMFGAMDDLSHAIGESYRRGKYLGRELREAGFRDMPQDLVNKIHEFSKDLVDMPTEYFEAKPQRAVGLNEFRAAVVPHSARARVDDILRQHGIEHVEGYDPDVPGDRARAVRAAADGQDLFLSEAEVDAEVLAKSGWDPEDLQKSTQTGAFLAEIEPFGWIYHSEGGKHRKYTNRFFAPPRPMELKHEHSRHMTQHWEREYLKGLGLRRGRGGALEANPAHAYYAHYQAAGLAPASEQAPAQVTWAPDEPHEHVPVGDLVSTRPLDHGLVAKYTGQLKRGQKLPAIRTEVVDGQHVIDEGDEVHQAAVNAGMTHVPVAKP